MPEVDGNDVERAAQLESKSCLYLATLNLSTNITSDTALYHAAIKPNTNQAATKMAVQSKEAEANATGKHRITPSVSMAHSQLPTGTQQTKADDEVVESNKADGKKPGKCRIASLSFGIFGKLHK